jgi:hypothetical protein
MHSWQSKVCKTCCHWSEAGKGICNLNQRACGQFYRCESWQAMGMNAQERDILLKAS